MINLCSKSMYFFPGEDFYILCDIHVKDQSLILLFSICKVVKSESSGIKQQYQNSVQLRYKFLRMSHLKDFWPLYILFRFRFHFT